jgi:tetratricopeptide (TPR) repeat protein
MNTSSLDAWKRYDAGHEALRRWDLDSAIAGFRAAVERDPQFPNAQLMLAQTLSWSGAPLSSWQQAAEKAVALATRLPAHDRSAASGLLSLANADFIDACAKYSALVREDSSDFAGWYGLGECHARDQAVLRDPKSPSGWRFRSSYNSAISAYRRALETVPSVHAAFAGPRMSRLERMMFTELRHYRPGYAVDRDSIRLAAFPTLVADSIAFIPWPFQDVMDGRVPLDATGRNAAVARMRTTLREMTRTWATAFPRSPEALRMHAAVLEVAGEISDSGGGESALAVIRRARRGPADSVLATRLAIDETRLHLKSVELDVARQLADSILEATAPSVETAPQLASLAALTGRADLAARMLRLAAVEHVPLGIDGRPVSVALPVMQSAMALLGYASLGAPRDSLVALERRLETQIESWVQPPLRKRVREALLERPLQLAFPELGYIDGGTGSPGGYLRGMQRALVSGDTAGVRRDFARIAAIRAEQRPGDVSVEITYQETILQLVLGDTAGAIRSLDRTLDALPTLGKALLDETPQAAALPRLMVLRARLANRRGETAIAHRWASGVLTLWNDSADEALRPTLEEMRRYATDTPRRNP